MTSSSQAWKRPKSPSAGARSLISHLQPGQKIVPAGDPTIGKYRYQQDSDAWSDIPNSAPGGVNDGSFTVTGLTNGNSYVFKLRAVNNIGEGVSSDAKTATPRTVPGAPQNVAAEPRHGAAWLTWEAPSSDGGAPVTGYQWGGGGSGNSWRDIQDSDGNTRSYLVPGLTNGWTYTLKVRAVNAAGPGAEADAAAAVTPSARGLVLSANTIPVDEGATATYTAALSDQPSATVTVAIESGDTAIATVDLSALTFTTSDWDTPQTVTVTGIADEPDRTDESVRITHTATGGGYDGVTAVVTVEVNDLTKNLDPEFTEGESVTRTISEDTGTGVDFGAPVGATDANGDELTYSLAGADAASFDIERTDGQLKTKAQLNHEEKPSHTVTVVVSDGDANVEIAVTINVTDVDGEAPGQPDAPTVELVTDDNSLMVSWAAPANSGPEITDYDVQYKIEGAAAYSVLTHDGTGTNAIIGVITSDTAYEVRVRATNAEGTGSWSEPREFTAENRAPVARDDTLKTLDPPPPPPPPPPPRKPPRTPPSPSTCWPTTATRTATISRSRQCRSPRKAAPSRSW